MEYEFEIEFSGICCHYYVDATNRIAILIDGRSPTPAYHYPHIEVQYGGVEDPGLLKPLKINGSYSYTRPNVGVTYEAYSLDRHRLSVPSIDEDLIPQPDFEIHTPHLLNVCPTFGAGKIKDFVAPVPSPITPVVAQFVYSGGILKVSPEKSEPTYFWPIELDPEDDPGQPRELATGVILTVRMDQAPVIDVSTFDGSKLKPFKLKDWVRRVRIGNMGEKGILGLDEVDSKHFLIYYKMADRPDSMPIPVPPAQVTGQPEGGLGGGCSNTQYP